MQIPFLSRNQTLGLSRSVARGKLQECTPRCSISSPPQCASPVAAVAASGHAPRLDVGVTSPTHIRVHAICILQDRSLQNWWSASVPERRGLALCSRSGLARAAFSARAASPRSCGMNKGWLGLGRHTDDEHGKENCFRQGFRLLKNRRVDIFLEKGVYYMMDGKITKQGISLIHAFKSNPFLISRS